MFNFIRPRSAAKVATLLTIGLFVSGSAVASDIPLPTKAPILPIAPLPAFETWTFSVTPYAWLTNINGSATVANRTKDIDATFDQLVRHFAIPKDLFEVAGYFEARKGRFSIFNDIVYEKVAISGFAAGSRTLSFRGIPVATASASVSASMRFQMLIDEIAAAYEVARWQSPIGAPGSTTALDLYAGARIWWQQADLDLGAAASLTGLGPLGLTLSGNRVVAKSGDVSWVDPVVGARVRQEFMPGQEITLSGDVGGFGAGSRFSWQAIGTYNFQIAKTPYITWSGMIGYKALYADYSQGSGIRFYRYDITEHGPILGVTARF